MDVLGTSAVWFLAVGCNASESSVFLAKPFYGNNSRNDPGLAVAGMAEKSFWVALTLPPTDTRMDRAIDLSHIPMRCKGSILTEGIFVPSSQGSLLLLVGPMTNHNIVSCHACHHCHPIPYQSGRA